MTAAFSCTSTKKSSKPNRATRALWDAIGQIVDEPQYDDMTLGVRQLYYQCVVRGASRVGAGAGPRVC